mmetsp:Transcript_122419/g.346081  ORF Transcript_122419/g.346081 Transcript_122419/m.346081 type:complete len:203 (-) Transcript_122419:2009-2617(-)
MAGVGGRSRPVATGRRGGHRTRRSPTTSRGSCTSSAGLAPISATRTSATCASCVSRPSVGGCCPIPWRIPRARGMARAWWPTRRGCMCGAAHTARTTPPTCTASTSAASSGNTSPPRASSRAAGTVTRPWSKTISCTSWVALVSTAMGTFSLSTSARACGGSWSARAQTCRTGAMPTAPCCAMVISICTVAMTVCVMTTFKN